jgi:hypothetical protein
VRLLLPEFVVQHHTTASYRQKPFQLDHHAHTFNAPSKTGEPQNKMSRKQSTGIKATRDAPLKMRKSALLDSTYESIPKIDAGQPFFITQFAMFPQIALPADFP